MLTAAFALALLIGFLRGGNVRHFAELELRALWLVLLAFALQFVMRVGGYGGPVLVGVGYAITYVMLLAFLVLNRSHWELMLLGAGLLSNATVIWVNGGKMPVSREAYLLATGAPLPSSDPTHIPLTAAAHLPWLSDIWVLPKPFPLPGVFSLGDVVVVIGLFLLIQNVMVPRSDRIGRRGSGSNGRTSARLEGRA